MGSGGDDPERGTPDERSIIADSRRLEGKAAVRRIGRWAFPVYELAQGGETLALMGRSGWFKIYLGPGQRVELAEGDRWRVQAVNLSGAIWPVVVDASGRKVAIAGESHGTYGINTRDNAYVFYQADPRRLGRRRWMLRLFEDDIAVVDRNPASIEAFHPVPLGVVFLCFVIARYGIPGELAPKLPRFRWG